MDKSESDLMKGIKNNTKMMQEQPILLLMVLFANAGQIEASVLSWGRFITS